MYECGNSAKQIRSFHGTGFKISDKQERFWIIDNLQVVHLYWIRAHRTILTRLQQATRYRNIRGEYN